MPPYTATAVARLNDAGMVMLGKTNTDEFAMGSSTENSAFFTTHNPWDFDRVPGGSSGGSAAVAADEALGVLGTDTGGSAPAGCAVRRRRPEAFLWPRQPLRADRLRQQPGPDRHAHQDVRDAALLLNVIAGSDPLDSTCLETPAGLYGGADGRCARVAHRAADEYFIDGMQPEVEASVRQAVAELERLGAEVVRISLPNTDKALPVYYLAATAEASANLAL